MARTVAEIYDAIIQEKEQQTTLSGLLPELENASNLLSDLTSDSKVAIWRLWAFITAVAIYTHEQVYDLFVVEVKAIADASQSGTVPWYRLQMLNFQFGYILVYSNFVYSYSTIDEAAKIISYCAVQERSDGALVIKVAKGDMPTPLTTSERQAAESYINKIKFAGTKLALTSLSPDVLTPNYQVYFDPIIPQEDLIDSIQIAVDQYLANLPFNGEYRLTSFTDVLQSVEGVVDAVEQSTTVMPDGGVSSSIEVRYVPAAGYFELSDTIENLFTFIPFVS